MRKAGHQGRAGEHGTFLNMNRVVDNFGGRIPMLPHHAAEDRKVLHPKHRSII